MVGRWSAVFRRVGILASCRSPRYCICNSLSVLPKVTIESLKRIAYSVEDWWFDLRNGIDTRGVIPIGSLHRPGSAEPMAHATAYQAVWCRNLRVLIRAARAFAEPDVFLDIGSGKGKACFFAAPSFGQVVGVEYSQDLIACAQVNLSKSGKTNIRFIQADAAQFDLPRKQSLVFLFNPFDAVILERFLARNVDCLRAHRSLIAYANDVQQAVLVQYGFECVFSDRPRRLSLWRGRSDPMVAIHPSV